MRTLRNGLLTVLFLAAVGAGLYGWWDLDLRWRPHVITKHADEIGKILQASGWVSPGLSGPKLYMISFRSCPDCVRFQDSEFPVLQKAGVDTRVIEIARADVNGQPKSTAIERSTVAELWVNRSWALYQKWTATPIDAWTAAGIPPADGDVARSAVVEAGRDAVDELTPLLADNGVKLAYPTLVWWTKDGKMEACACEDPRSDRYLLHDLGAG